MVREVSVSDVPVVLLHAEYEAKHFLQKSHSDSTHLNIELTCELQAYIDELEGDVVHDGSVEDSNSSQTRSDFTQCRDFVVDITRIRDSTNWSSESYVPIQVFPQW